MQKISPYLKADYLLLLLILLISIVLRFWNLKNIPYMFDELSALMRVNYSSFHDLIRYGVMEDGHPAGVQVFLFYWTKLFGTSEITVKMPFLILGVASVYLSWKLGCKWFNKTTGLIVASYIATLQFPIMYSQIARPYITGLFFSLWMVLSWTELLFGEKEKRRISLIGFAIASSLCAYNHYFSAMFAGIVWLTGLFFLKREVWKEYLLSGILIGLLYVPHIPIFIYQLHLGGLEWLGKPRSDFWSEHILYIFHYSIVTIITALLVCVLSSFYFFRKEEVKENRRRMTQDAGLKLRIVSIVWFILPIIVGYYYSVLYKPLLQSSMLLFTFPFLLLFLFSSRKEFSSLLKVVVISGIIIVNVISLVFGREHYNVFYHQAIPEMVKQSIQVNHQFGKDVTIVLNTQEDFLSFLFKKNNASFPYRNIYDRNPSAIEFRSYLETQYTSHLFLGAVPRELFLTAREIYPYVESYDFVFLGEMFLLSKGKNASDIIYPEEISAETNFSSAKPNFSFTKSSVVYDTSCRYHVLVTDSATQMNPSYTPILGEIAKSKSQFIDVQMSVKINDSLQNGMLVAEITKDGKLINWRASYLHDWIDKTNSWQNIYVTVRLANDFKHNDEMKDAKLNIYFQGSSGVQIKEFKIGVEKGNPFIYGLYERL